MLNIFTAGDRGLIIDEEGPTTLVAIGSYVTCVSSSFADKLTDCAHCVLKPVSVHPTQAYSSQIRVLANSGYAWLE